MPDRNDIVDDEPMTLAEACDIVFRGRIKPATLRAEAAKGNLIIERIGRRDFVIRAAIREMREKCRVQPKGPVFGKARLLAIRPSETEGQSAALAAALQSARALRKRTKPTLADLGSTGDLIADKAFQKLVALAVAADADRKERRKRRGDCAR